MLALLLFFSLTLPTTSSCLCLHQSQSLSGLPAFIQFCDGRSQLSCICRECLRSRASESRLWCKRLDSWAKRSPGPKRRCPAAPHYTPEDHQSHPEQGRGRKMSLFLPSHHHYTDHLTLSNALYNWENTWQASLPPSRYPAHTMRSVIMPG